MDVDILDGDVYENESASRKNRIQLYKNILNYYRGRSLSLDSILASHQPSANVIPAMKTQEELCRNIQGLYDDIILIQSIKNSLKLINNYLTCTEVMRANESNFKRDNLNKIEGIIYFSKSIMKLYNESCNELNLIEKMKNYNTVLTEYTKSLNNLKEKEKNKDEHSREVEKLELQVYRINLMRAMKSVLIGYTSLNCPSLLRNFQSFRSSVRRDLTIEDFQDTWNVGLSS